MSDGSIKISDVNAILFDLHQTITDITETMMSLTRRVSNAAGVDLSEFSDEEIQNAVEKCDEWFKAYQIENDVDIYFGSEIEHWTDFNKRMFQALGFEELSNEFLLSVEGEWKKLLMTWEILRPDALDTLSELHKRGYILESAQGVQMTQLSFFENGVSLTLFPQFNEPQFRVMRNPTRTH